MKYWVVCLNLGCEFKEKRELVPTEEAIRQKIQTSLPRCHKCGSNNVRTEKV
jgi:hypothetical protein